jgi:DNA-binding IclR family transcriptional regulator
MSSTGIPRTQSLTRATRLLQAIAERPGGSSASELARATGQPRSTVSRSLRTLADSGLVDETESGAWLLGYELIRLARAADPNRRLVEVARPELEGLRDLAGESSLLAVPRGATGMEILLQLDPERHVGVANWVGTDVPLHASSAGKLVLAELAEPDLATWLRASSLVRFTEKTFVGESSLTTELERVRRQGWADLVDELEDGLASISVPVRSSAGTLIGIVGISGPTFRLSKSRRRELVPALRATAAAVERGALV